jgi:hypothetical protein
MGWAGEERMSLASRGPADCVLALGLIHHLAIGNNVPLDEVCRYLARLGRWAGVEFVPKEDSQVARLLRSREDIFPGYRADAFEESAGRHFRVAAKAAVRGTVRTLYLLGPREHS